MLVVHLSMIFHLIWSKGAEFLPTVHINSHTSCVFHLWLRSKGIVLKKTPHIVHSRLWKSLCLYKSIEDPKVRPHDSTGHLWTIECLWKWAIIQSFLENLLSQPVWRHTNGSSPVCILSWASNTNRCREVYILPQWLHFKSAGMLTGYATNVVLLSATSYVA